MRAHHDALPPPSVMCAQLMMSGVGVWLFIIRNRVLYEGLAMWLQRHDWAQFWGARGTKVTCVSFPPILCTELDEKRSLFALCLTAIFFFVEDVVVFYGVRPLYPYAAWLTHFIARYAAMSAPPRGGGWREGGEGREGKGRGGEGREEGESGEGGERQWELLDGIRGEFCSLCSLGVFTHPRAYSPNSSAGS